HLGLRFLLFDVDSQRRSGGFSLLAAGLRLGLALTRSAVAGVVPGLFIAAAATAGCSLTRLTDDRGDFVLEAGLDFVRDVDYFAVLGEAEAHVFAAVACLLE